jgi:hypothetical protein
MQIEHNITSTILKDNQMQVIEVELLTVREKALHTS